MLCTMGRAITVYMLLRMIAVDLDDTLLTSSLTISEANATAIAEARARGIRVVLASGRNIYSMKKYAMQLGLDGPGEYMICSNGAEIIETATSAMAYRQAIDGPLCIDIAEAIKGQGFSYQLYEDGRIRASGGNAWTSEDTRLTGQKLDILAPDEERDFLLRGHLKFVIPGEPERIARLLDFMTRHLHGRAEVFISKPYFLEILPAGVNKGTALAMLAGMLGIDMEDVLARCDSMNDAAMLRMAGTGCAPANASIAARDAADYICDATHDEDAVALILRRFLDGPELETED